MSAIATEDLRYRYTADAPWALDGNSVNPEREAVKLTQNSVVYNALTTSISKRMSMLRYAASDGRS